MKNNILLLSLMAFLYIDSSAQSLALNYPYPEKQIERFLTLPENLDTLTTDHFLLFQFRINNGKATNIEWLGTYPALLPDEYHDFALEKLKLMDFSGVVYSSEIKWYGTSLMLKLKPKKYGSWEDQKLTYDQRLDYIVSYTARFAGLNAEDYNYIKPKYPEMLIQIIIGPNKTVTVNDLYENRVDNTDERYWQVFDEIAQEIKKIRLPPNTTEGDEFNIRLDFYKKLEWKSE